MKSNERWFRAIAVIFATALCASLASCASIQGKRDDKSEMKAVNGYMAALNRRDLLALTLYVAPDVEWYSIMGSERVLEVSGRQALTASLQSFFDRYSKTRWSIRNAQIVGDRVAVAETSEWNDADGTRSRTSLGIFEMNEGRIRRITYFLEGG